MATDIPAPPRLDAALLESLRADLRAARYTVPVVEDLLGPLTLQALHRENPWPARRILAESAEPAAALAALFTLGAALPAERIAKALPSLGLDGAARLGLIAADADGTVRALMDLSAYSATDDLGDISWWIASDLSELATGRALHGEHVLGVGGASLTLARLTPRATTGRVLDLGCGGGIQAMHAARHADAVVATDLSERALAFAAFNAALNGIDLDLRHGSLLEPVAGERFDLIVTNPPFVITPRSTAQEAWTYRDGGRAGDTLLAELLAGLPAHLAPGGRAVMLANWEIPVGSDWDAHPRAWLETASADGVDAWVIQRESEDPAQYAETWARDGGITLRDPAWPDMMAAWLEDFDSREVERIGFGYVLMRRRDEAPAVGALRCEEVAGSGSGTLSSHLADALTMIGRLDGLGDDELWEARPVRAEDVVERRFLTPGAWDPTLIELVQGAGFARTVRADQLLAATVGALDGTLTLGQTVTAVCSLTGEDVEEARARMLPAIRELLIGGLLHL